jgi:hypothetical protein
MSECIKAEEFFKGSKNFDDIPKEAKEYCITHQEFDCKKGD